MNFDERTSIQPVRLTPRAAARRARDRHLVSLADSGMTLQEMGDLYGISSEMVRVVLARAGITGADLREARRLRAERQRAADRSAIIAWAHTNPGRGARQAAEALGMTSRQIREAVGAEVGSLFVREPARSDRVYSDVDIARALQAAAGEMGDPLAKNDYDAYVLARGGITSVRILQRYGGSWNAACRAAGLVVNRGRRHYSRRWSTPDLVEHVVAYLESEDATGAYYDFDRWARLDADRPSAQSVRNYLGSWGTAKRLALQEQARRRDERLTGVA
jgi:hypothetical protein